MFRRRRYIYGRSLCRRENVVIRKLQIVQASIGSAVRHEFGVRAAFADLAVFKHKNLIRTANGCQTMRDDKSGAADHQIGESFLHIHFGLGIQFRSCFVENEDGRVFKYGTRDGDALPLAAAQAGSAFADHSVILLRQFRDEIVGQRGLGGGNNAVLGNTGQAVTDVVPHRVVEKNIFLGDHGDLLAEGADRNFTNIHAIDSNGAGSQLVEPRKQIYEGSFARAA